VFQRNQFPPAFQNKLTLMHDSIDTDFFSPKPSVRIVLPGLDLAVAITAGNYGADDQWVPPTRVLREVVLESVL